MKAKLIHTRFFESNRTKSYGNPSISKYSLIDALRKGPKYKSKKEKPSFDEQNNAQAHYLLLNISLCSHFHLASQENQHTHMHTRSYASLPHP